MAKEKEALDPEVAKLKEEKKQFKEDQKKEKKEQKARKKEAKKKAKELADEEARIMDDESGGGLPVFITTVIIILVWIGIICALIKLDVGGFGSGVLAPVLKDVPVVNKILPNTQTPEEDVDTSGYDSIKEAAKEVKDLENENTKLNEATLLKDQQIAALEEEVKRLKTFEEKQVEFERIKTEFYNEVVYAENGPGADEYVKYYEGMDPATAEALYKQVIVQQEEDKEIQNYARAYSEMKPAAAAAIFEDMTDNLDLVAKILWQMEPDARGAILAAMNPEVAAKLTKLMDPD